MPVTPRCHIPWQEMNIDADGNVTPCCNWRSHENTDNPYCGNAKTQSLEEIWNGPVYRNLRKQMAAGDIQKAGCAKCVIIVRGEKSPLRYDPDVEKELNSSNDEELTAYAQNIKTLKREIAEGAEVVAARPTVLSVTPSYACNIRCVHCYQEPLRSKDMDHPPLFEQLVALTPTMSHISCGGGEPLLLPIWQDFLKTVDIKKNPYLTFAACTNATVVSPTVAAKIGEFKRVQIGVSMDAGTKEVYERVRLRSKFEPVDANIDRLASIAAAKPGSYVSLSMSVMRDNIEDMANFFAYGTSKGSTVALSPVMALPADQTITCLRNPREDLTRWRCALDEAERKVQEIDLSLVFATDRMGSNAANMDILRENYMRQIAFVRKQIPWRVEELRHIEVSATVPTALIEQAAADRKRSDLLVVFSPIDQPAVTPPLYFAKIEDGEFTAHLAAGQYRVGVIARFEWPRYEENLRVSVSGNGELTFHRALAGTSVPGVIQFGDPISSGEHDVYRAMYAFQENTNSWVSAQSAKAVGGSAFLGIDLGERAQQVREIHVQWVADYATPAQIAVDSADGEEWTEDGIHQVSIPAPGVVGAWQSFGVNGTEARRRWRIRAATPALGLGHMAVMQIRFIGRAPAD